MTLEHKFERRGKLLNTLKQIQRKHGYLPEDEVRKLSKKVGIPVTEIYSTATFYSLLNTEQKGKKIVRICNSPSCYLNGSLNVLKETKKILKIGVGKTTKNGKFSLELTSCIGCCDKAPAIMINEELITDVTKEKLKKLLK